MTEEKATKCNKDEVMKAWEEYKIKDWEAKDRNEAREAKKAWEKAIQEAK